jgi:predicted glycosyltransferase involved in capsule biosynthesis
MCRLDNANYIKQENTNFFNQKNICKNCMNDYGKEKIECKICNIITSRNYYYKHMKITSSSCIKTRNSPKV